MTTRILAIVFYISAIIVAYIGIKMIIWLKKHNRADINQSEEELDDFYLQCQTKRLGIVISFMLTVIFLLLAYIFSH